MDPKLLDDLVKEFFVDGQGLADSLLRLRLFPKICKQSIHQRNIRVIPAEEKVVGMPVSVGMHENGATRISVAPGAADLLVIPFHTARQCGVDHGSNVRLIDSHPECYGCYHDIELTGHEFFLDSLPPLGIQPGM